MSLFLLTLKISAQTTWTGATSSNWNTATNWSPAAVPTATTDVVISNPAPANHPILTSNQTVRDLTVSNGILNMAGFQIRVNRNFRSTGGNITNGALSVNDFTLMQNTTFNGAITLTKTGSGDDDVNGGNVFNGPTTIILADNNRFRFATTTGDTFNNIVTFQNQNVNFLDIAFSGSSTFASTITLNNLNAGGEIRFGEGGGTALLSTGSVTTTNFTVGAILEFNNFTQVQNVANGSFGVAIFNSVNSSFQGNFQVTATTSANFTGPNTYARNATFSAPSITMANSGNNFATSGGIASFTKTSGTTTNNWNGGSTFGTVVITNNTNAILRLANAVGDTFLSTSTFTNTGTNFIDIAFNGASTFAGSITINNTNVNGDFGFGRGNGTSTLTTGALLTTNFTTGATLDIQDFTQVQNSPNSPFGVATFNSANSSFQGDFQVTATTSANFTGANTYARNVNFSAPSITMSNAGNSFSATSGLAQFTKTGGIIDNFWNGGGIFGTVLVINNSNAVLRLANVAGDTFLSTSTFNNTGTNFIDIAFNGASTFAGSITINNTNVNGDFGFGRGNGTSTLTTGALLTTNFTTGATLDIQDFTQVQNSPNSPFGVAAFNSANSNFQGDFQVTATGSASFIGPNTYARNVTFIAPSIAMTNAGNNFATTGGLARFSKTGAANNDWNGGSTFGRLEVNYSAAGRLRLASNVGDTYLSSSLFNNSSTGTLEIAQSGTNTFAESITINNTNAAGIVAFGRGPTGASTLTTGALLTTNFTTGNTLDIQDFTQVQNIPNSPFGVAVFNASNSRFQGNFQVNATTSINFINSNTFARNASFTAPSLTASGANSFAVTGGVANFTKAGALPPSNTWNGGNTFGETNFRHNTGGVWRLAGTVGDTFLGNVSFVRTSTGTLEPTFAGTNSFSGNISTVGTTAAISFGIGGTGVVSIVGNTVQQLQGDLVTSPTINRLVMNTTGRLQLAVPLSISSSATFTNGILASDPTNVLIVISGASSSGMSNASHVDGPVRKLGNQSFVFPVGNGGFYAPVTLATGGGATDAYIAQYFHASPVSIPTDTVSKDPTIGLMNQSEYWNINRAIGTVPRNLTLSYSIARTSPMIDHTELVSIRYDGTAWRDIGGVVVGNSSSGTVTALTSLAGPRLYSIASSFRVLPVELLTFEARITESKDILVNWTTSSERNNSHFLLEKSENGQDWDVLSIVPGSGDTNELKAYHVLDTNPRYGRQFYRLIQVDLDGSSITSNVIGLSLAADKTEQLKVAVYPNPNSGTFTLEGLNTNLDGLQMELIDVSGKSWYTSSSLKNKRTGFDFSSLPKGIYLLRLSSSRELLTKRVIIQ